MPLDDRDVSALLELTRQRSAKIRSHRRRLAGSAVVVLGVVIAATLLTVRNDQQEVVHTARPPVTSVGREAPGSLHDVVQAHWANLAPPPSVLAGRSGVAWAESDRYVLAWGGRVDGGPVANDGAVYDRRTDRWNVVGSDAKGRFGAEAVVVGDIAYIVGGVGGPNGDAPLSSVLTFDLSTPPALFGRQPRPPNWASTRSCRGTAES